MKISRWYPLFFAALLLSACATVSTAGGASASAARTLEMTWPEVAYPAVPSHMLGNPPAVPRFLPLGPRAGVHESLWKRYGGYREELDRRMVVLITAHPDPIVRRLAQPLADGDLCIGYLWGNPSSLGQFSFSNCRTTDGAQRWRPRIAIAPELVASLDTDTAVRIAMLIIRHEAEHYEQWRSGPPAIRAYFERSSSPLVSAPTRWRIELDAYIAECRTAIAWGIPDAEGGMCRRITSFEAFRRAVFYRIAAQRLDDPEALYTLAIAAGHPNPNLVIPFASQSS